MDSGSHPASGLAWLDRLPARVDLYEVGPRDGLQNEPKVVPTRDKVALVRALLAAGVRRLEVTSFVSPKWIPQLADADKLLAAISAPPGVVFSALVPNLRGLARARDVGLTEAALFVSATDSHSKRNINKTIAEALEAAQEVARGAAAAKMRVRAYLSCVWGCPYEGETPVDRVVTLCRQLSEMGIYQLSLGDTIGVGTPRRTRDILEALLAHLRPEQLALHLHDTRGTALANALVGLGYGITTLDASVGGLGGCPYAPGAAGNLATEDLLYMLDEMGVQTGVSLDRLVDAGALAQRLVGRKLPGKYLQAALGEREKKAKRRAQT